MDSKNLKDQRRGGFYWKGEKPYVSVTTVIGIIDKPMLRRWYGEQVYNAMLANPNLRKEDALAAPSDISSQAKNRGSTVHSMVEAYKQGNKIEEVDIPEQYKGYATAFYKWADQHPLSILEQEKSIFSEEYKYAGTLDMLVKINGSKEITLLDIKTGKYIYQEAYLQTAAYQNALREQGITADNIGVLLLQSDGSFKFEVMGDFTRKFEGFLACKKIWEALNEEMLKKIGYFS